MQSRIVVCCLGLLSLGGLIGCGHERFFRCPDCANSEKGNRSMVEATPNYPRTESVSAHASYAKQPLPTVVGALKSPTSTTLPEFGTAPLVGEKPKTLPVPQGRMGTILPPVDVNTPIIQLPPVTLPDQIPGNPNSADKEERIQKQSYVIRYGPTDNFKVVTGQLQQWRKTWYLRYATVDMIDPYGGSLELQSIADTSKLKDGIHARVQGVLIPPDSRQDSARYIVKSIEILD
jgi:hypothetical protein